MKRIKHIEVLTDDLTKEEITMGGWELRPLSSPVQRPLHFSSLSSMIEFFLTGRYNEGSEDYFVGEMERRNIRVEVGV